MSKLYDRGNDDWLDMENGPREWAVAYHGVRGIPMDVDSQHVFHLILEGRKKGTMLKPGQGQAYQSDMCVNKPK